MYVLKNAVEDCILLLAFVLVMAAICSSEGTRGGADARQPAPERIVKQATNFDFTLDHCLYGGQDVPCCGYTLHFDDGTSESRIIAYNTFGNWKKFFSACGAGLDEMQLRVRKEQRAHPQP